MMDRQIDLSVVIPAYNESERLPVTLARILEYLDGRPGRSEVVVSDDGSLDGTGDLATEILGAQSRHAWKVVRGSPNRGKGHATRVGMIAAAGRTRLLSDADLSTPIEELGKLEAALARGYDVAIASRGMSRSEIVVRQPFYREFAGRVFNLIMRILVLPGICDSQCGFKLFTAEAARAVFPLATINGWIFDVEVLLLARRKGFRIAEIPARWIDSPYSRVSMLGSSAGVLAEILRIRWKYLS
jgi:dolichyl-phosphate beta-glucosyltransferase